MPQCIIKVWKNMLFTLKIYYFIQLLKINECVGIEVRFVWLWVKVYLSLMGLLTLNWRQDWLEYERQEEDLK